MIKVRLSICEERLFIWQRFGYTLLFIIGSTLGAVTSYIVFEGAKGRSPQNRALSQTRVDPILRAN